MVVLLLGAWLITRSDDSGPSSQPAVIESPTTTVPGAGATSATTVADHFASDLVALAPAGYAIRSQGGIEAGSDAATGEFEELAAALASDRTTGTRATFGPAADVVKGGGDAGASISVYATPEAAARAYDAARGFFLSDRRTGAGNREIDLPSNLALRSFAFEHGKGAQRVATAYLQFPGGLVELTTTGLRPASLGGMVAVVSGWALP